MKTLIKNAVIVNADGRQTADLLIEDGIVAAIGENLEADGEVIDANGAICCPDLSICTATCAIPAMNIRKTSSPAPVLPLPADLPECSAWQTLCR